MKWIDMYILHNSSLGVCFSNISGYFAKSETRHRADIFMPPSPRKKVKEASAMLSFSPVSREMADRSRFSSGHCRYA